jgi:hypothetical protein
VTGDADAQLPSMWVPSLGAVFRTARRHIVPPVARSIAMTTNSTTWLGLCPSCCRHSGSCASASRTFSGSTDSSVLTAVTRKMRSFQMIGVDSPSPGIGAFQRMFFRSLHSSGGVPCGATPSARGPRHCGH